jgi:hypothetical protein
MYPSIVPVPDGQHGAASQPVDALDDDETSTGTDVMLAEANEVSLVLPRTDVVLVDPAPTSRPGRLAIFPQARTTPAHMLMPHVVEERETSFVAIGRPPVGAAVPAADCV